MRSAQIAEWILALFLEPDRAAAYAGDLMEESAEHGRVWFWSSAARLAIMRFWQDLSESPLCLAGVLLDACIQNIIITFLIILGCAILLIPIALLAWSLHAGLAIPLPRDEQLRWLDSILNSVGGLAVSALAALYTGRWIAEKTPGREIAACLAMNVVQPLFWNVIAFVIMQIGGASLEHYLVTHANANQTASILPDSLIWPMTFVGLLGGGLRTRLRRTTQ